PAVLVLVSCGNDPSPPPEVAPRPSSTKVAATAEPASGLRTSFENPGGMWMPHQMAAHAAKLKEIGFRIDPAALTDPTSSVLGAIVYLGGCSGSFVSPEALVMTNHHCATGALQYSSTPEKNLLRDGFVAKA